MCLIRFYLCQIRTSSFAPRSMTTDTSSAMAPVMNANPTLTAEVETNPMRKPPIIARKKKVKSATDNLNIVEIVAVVEGLLRDSTANSISTANTKMTIVKKPGHIPQASNVGFGGS